MEWILTAVAGLGWVMGMVCTLAVIAVGGLAVAAAVLGHDADEDDDGRDRDRECEEMAAGLHREVCGEQ